MAKTSPRSYDRALRVEPLEQRRVLATLAGGLVISSGVVSSGAAQGDVSADAVTNAADSAVWQANFGDDYQTAGGAATVGGASFLAWQRNYSPPTGSQPLPSVSQTDAEAARDALLAGVSQIAVVGAPGEIAVFDPPGAADGQGAFAVMHDGAYRPMVAAAVWGGGKVVAFGHNGYTDFSGAGDQLDTGQLYLNSVAWSTGVAGTSQTVVTPSSGTRNWLVAQGFTNVSVHSDWENHLAGADLLIAELGPNVSSAKQTAVADFVQNGGGLITGGTGWGYQQLGNDLKTIDGNAVLRQAGLSWADGFRSGTTNATRRSTELANASQALEFAKQFWAGGSGTQAQQQEAGEALQTVLAVLPDSHPLAVAIGQAFASRAGTIAATPDTPVSNALDKAVLTWESNQLAATPVAQVVAHHSAEAVYGVVPADAPRVTETVTLDTSRSRWHATGLYAAPGEIVTVTVPASLVGRGYRVRINAHTDDISPRDAWERMPVVHRSFEITQTTTQAASAFGGLVFIDFGSTPPGAGNQDVTIAGAVEAPYFVLGEHTDEDWNNQLRDRPAPYGVFVSEHLINVVPKRQIESADLTEPTALMTWWNDAVRLQDELAGQEAFRTSPELINVDVQNSAGAAHAGFPIQAYEKFWDNLSDWDTLQTQGSWGNFHELGHNHQRGWWTFSGDGEVTVNIFANYALEQLAPESTNFWAYSADPVATMQTAIGDVAGGGSYSSKSDRWSFWFQLADGFGWDAYKNVFAGYEADASRNPAALPNGDQAEKDQWFTRWSNEVGYDMRKFMVDTWGLSVSQSAINSVASLPDWMPLATTITDFQIDEGETLVLPTQTAGRGMDGVATLVGVSSGPTSGTLTDNGDGTHTYAPGVAGGTDSFTLTYQSSAGNTQDFKIDVLIGNGFTPGDVNLNGTLEMDDVTQFVQYWRSDTSGLDDPEKVMQGDLNLDGVTNFADWFILRAAWNDAFGESLNLQALLDDASSDAPAVRASLPEVAIDQAFDEFEVDGGRFL